MWHGKAGVGGDLEDRHAAVGTGPGEGHLGEGEAGGGNAVDESAVANHMHAALVVTDGEGEVDLPSRGVEL